MTLKELARKAFKIMREELGNEYSEKIIWQAIAETSDDAIYSFVIERSNHGFAFLHNNMEV